MPWTPEPKPLCDLRSADIAHCPVWQYVNNSYRKPHDESQPVCPRPTLHRIEFPNPVGLCVGASFTLADGPILTGIFKPGPVFSWSKAPDSVSNVRQDGSTLFHMQPYVLTRAGPVRLWQCDHAFSRDQMDRFYQLVNRSAVSVFPMTLTSLVPVAAQYYSSAVIPGFISCTNPLRTIQ